MKQRIVHPIFFALFPVLSLLSANLLEVSASAIILPLIIILPTVMVIWGALSRVLKSREKAALVSSIAVFCFFAYGHITLLVSSMPGIGVFLDGKEQILALVGIGMILALSGSIARSKRSLHGLSSVFTVISIALVAASLLNIGFVVLSETLNRQQIRVASAREFKAIGANEKTAAKPDIYYLIFDRYSSSQALSEFLDFDNYSFSGFLEERGFYIADKSLANYARTHLSLASSLNLEYHRRPIADKEFFEQLQDYTVWRFLKAQGYRFYHFGDWWEPTQKNRFADYNFDHPALNVESFSWQLFGASIAYPLAARQFTLLDKDERRRRVQSAKFKELGETAKKSGPKFVFAHMLIPHDPYLFDRQGNPTAPDQVRRKKETDNYKDYIVFANKKIEKLISDIQSNSDQPPIIIVQADEGFTPDAVKKNGPAASYWDGAGKNDLRLHMRILNAYFLPGAENQSALYESISPVNTFRLIFNLYFGTDYALLDDESYNLSAKSPQRFFPITDMAGFD